MAEEPKQEEKQEQQQVISEQPDKLEGGETTGRVDASGKRLWLLALTALGIVYGDIGTSPLYAFRFAVYREGQISPTADNVLGVLSLIFWALTTVISIKYISYVMRADNEGEGGILALMAILAPAAKRSKRPVIVALGMFGAALFYVDGMITPAISVLSAVEGLEIATPFFQPYIIAITVFILVLLFIFQRRGTRGVGSVFGPVMLVLFSTIGCLGILFCGSLETRWCCWPQLPLSSLPRR